MRKPPREIPTPCEGIEQRRDDEEAKQKRINSIIARALAFIRNGQQKEALRELAKEELKDISEVIEDEEGSVRPDGQAFPYGQGGRAVANEARRCPTCFDSMHLTRPSGLG